MLRLLSPSSRKQMPTQTAPAIRFTMSDNATAPMQPPPTVTLSLEPECRSPTHPKTKRNLLSTLKNSPSMLRRRMKPPHLNHNNRNSWDSTDSPSPASKPPGSFTGKEFHVKYQGRVRVTTLQVSEAVNAVKKLAPELTAASSASSSTEDLSHAPSSPSISSLSSSPSSLTLPRASSPTSPAVPKSPRSAKSPKSFYKSCCLSISKQCVCIDDEEKVVNETIPIATVAYCATDLRYPRAVTLICKTHSSVLMCHVFVCSSRDKAEKIVAFIGKAFESAWQDWKSVHDPSTLGSNLNNNYNYFIRGRSRSFDHTGAGRAGSPGEITPERHSSYEILRNDDFSSSPDDD